MTGKRQTTKRTKPERPSLDLDPNNVEQIEKIIDSFRAGLEEKPNGKPESAPSPERPESRKAKAEPAPAKAKVLRSPPRKHTGKLPDIELAREPNILPVLAKDARRAGVAGEERFVATLSLGLMTRGLPARRPTERLTSMIAKGSTSTGKSYSIETTLKFVPESAYIDLGSMSKKYLLYTDEEFARKFLYVPELAAIKDDPELVAMVRTLVSEGRLTYGTVDEHRVAFRIEREGPTGLLAATTDVFVDAELETRCLSIRTDDTPQQTGRIYDVYADMEEGIGGSVNFDRWHELQEWLVEDAATLTVIPWMRHLGKQMPTNATRLRRDYPALLSLVRIHAILHQAHRKPDKDGRIIATIKGDYAPVRQLVGPLISEGIGATVSDEIRDTVEAVADLLKESGNIGHVSPAAVEKQLGLGQSATYTRINNALAQGYLVNESETRRKKLVIGTALPGAAEYLPTPEEVFRSFSGDPTGKTLRSTMRDEKADSGIPAIPATPQVKIDFDGRPL